MKIKEFKVKGLFGLFNYSIAFQNAESMLTIITGPNGYGKTTILNILKCTFNKNFEYLAQLEFEEIEILFNDNFKLKINKFDNNVEFSKKRTLRMREYDILREESKIVKIILLKDDRPIGEIDHVMATEEYEEYIFRMYLSMRKSGKDKWRRLLNEKKTYTKHEVIQYFKDELPVEIVNRYYTVYQDNEISRFLNSLKLYMIKEQRLIKMNEEQYSNTIEDYASELVFLIKEKRQDAYTVTQNLDSTFPKRLIECKNALEAYEFKFRFEKLKEKQSLMQEFGFSISQFNNFTDYSDNTAKVLSVYLQDSEKKTEVYNDLLAKIELFLDIINNKRFTHKTISINSEKGFIFTTSKGVELALSDLSSGEQHEVVLFYELLFKADSNTIVLIDEPEISLHVLWQKSFIEDLLRVMKLQNISVIVATHSPQIINNRWHLVQDLYDLSQMEDFGYEL